MLRAALFDAIIEAEAMEREIGGDRDAAFRALDASIARFEDEGYPLDAVLPQGAEAGLGMALRRKDGEGFFAIYARLLRAKLCTQGGEFNRLINDGIHAGVGSILTLIAAAVGAPTIALGLLVPVAVIISQTGLEAFCEIAG